MKLNVRLKIFLINRRNGTRKGYFNIPFARLRIFDKYKEVSPPTVPGYTVSKDGDRFSEYDPMSPSTVKDQTVQCQSLLTWSSVTIKELTQVIRQLTATAIGQLIATSIEVLPAPLQY